MLSQPKQSPPYSQYRATMAIARASFISFIKSPSALIFSVVFPIIFIVLFGAMRGGGDKKVTIYVDNHLTDTVLISQIKQSSLVKIDQSPTLEEAKNELRKGNIDAIVQIDSVRSAHRAGSLYELNIISSSIALASGQLQAIQNLFQYLGNRLDTRYYPNNQSVLYVQKPSIIEAKIFKPIDFILPGQLGFSLISTGIFGVAFSFFFLRKTGVLKRMFATPIKKPYIILGEGIARITFQMMTAVIIIGFGYFLFDFTLIDGWWTVIQMLFVCFLALIVFMSIGFLISNLFNQEQAIPGVANLVTIPQFLLSGAFFSPSFFPKWLQNIAEFLPLTHVNNALRKISFEGKNLWEVKMEIGILLAFGLVFYLLNAKYFKWG